MRNLAGAFLEGYVDTRHRLFRSRSQAGLITKILLALTMAVITGLSAQLRVPLPWSPVPITGQTLAVLLSGVLLGRWWGAVSMALYVLLGVSGVPWFNGWSGGMAHLLGPTGGYLLGFVLSGLFVGYVTDRYIKARGFTSMVVLMLASNFIIIYGLGLTQLGLWLSFFKRSPVTLTQLLWMGAVPFVLGDAIKAVLAALIAKGITPKTSYGNEADDAK